ncbi:carbohydrate ABC transporter permease [Leifsonia sp. L25]|uniref:carbohydrate ABC transporter permease n=1 Tax=Actinomycetes TaxID=1760 RepID=UPI003D68BF33
MTAHLRESDRTTPAALPAETPRTRSRTRRPRRRLLEGWVPYLFIAPFLLSFLIFFAVPSAFSIALSFFKYRGYGQASWAGIDNYASLFQSPDFWQSVSNTLFYWLVPVVPLIGGAFLLALLVRSRLSAWPRAYKPLLFVPQVMAPVAAAIVWRVILSSEGVLNSVFGININWISDPTAGKWGVVLLLIWRGIGWYFVIFLSGLTSVPDELLEAAELDGAGTWTRIRYIIVPMMRPIFLFAVVIDTISSLQLFTEPNLLLGNASSPAGAPPSAAPIMNQVVLNITSGQFGLAAAVGWLMFIAIGIFSIIQFRLFREDNR